MAPIIHCVRHAQGFHNLGAEFHSLPDPRLTPLGESQCATLSSSLGPDFHSRIAIITASPLRRTLHTAHLSFRPALASDTCHSEIIAIPDAQEISDYPCDTGSDPEVLRARCEEHSWPADLSLVHEGWNVKAGKYEPISEAIVARAAEARRLLRRKVEELVEKRSGSDDVEVVLVSHGGYLHFLTGDWEGATSRLGTGWANCEMRSYNFAEHRDDYQVEEEEVDQLWFVETPESRRKRGLDAPMKERAEQRELFEEALEGWREQGLTAPLAVPSPEQAPRVENDHDLDSETLERILTTESCGSAVEVSA